MCQNSHILLAFSNREILRSLTVTFESFSPNIHTATTFSEALDAINSYSINLAIVDVGVPGNTELQIVREIKERSPHTETIIYSQKTAPTIFLDSVDLKVFAFLDKTMFNPAHVLTLATRALENQYYKFLSQKRYKQVKSLFNAHDSSLKFDGRRDPLKQMVKSALVVSDCECGQVVVVRNMEVLMRECWDGSNWVEDVDRVKVIDFVISSDAAGNREANVNGEGVQGGIIPPAYSLNSKNLEYYLAVPILNNKLDLVGVLEVGSRAKGAFMQRTQEEQALLEGLARAYAPYVEGINVSASTSDSDGVQCESEDYFKNYLEIAHDLIFLIQNNKLKYMNRMALMTLSYDRVAIQRLNVLDIAAKGHKELLLENISKTLAGESVPNFELVLLNQKGERVVLDVTSVLTEYQGNPAVQMIGRNITDNLLENTETVQLAGAIECLHSAVTITDMDLNIQYINPSHVQIFGYELEELVGKKSSILYPFEDPSGISKKIYEAVLLVGWDGERFGVRKKGEVFPVYEKTSVVKDKDGTPRGIVSVIEDISLRKRLERALRDSEERYRTMVETATTAIIAVDKEGVVKLFNPAAEELFGYSSSEMLGQSIEPLVPDKYRTVFQTGADNFLANNASQFIGKSIEFVGQKKSGSKFPIDISISECKIEGQKIYTAILVDITERKHLQQQLLQSEKMAAVGQLVAGVTHEVNNPLAVVMGYSEMLLMEEDLNDDMRKYLQVIYDEAQKSKDVIQDLLSFARMHEPDKQLVNVNDIIKKTLTLKEYDFKKHDVEVKYTPAPDISTILADPNQIQQVLLNLLINAEYSMVSRNGKRGSRLLIDTKSNVRRSDGRDAGTSFVEIYVSDNGKGIDEEFVNKIFDPFFTTKPEGEGTGLGLSVSYGIIEDHKGEIRAFNNDEGGATFRISLPITQNIEVESASA